MSLIFVVTLQSAQYAPGAFEPPPYSQVHWREVLRRASCGTVILKYAPDGLGMVAFDAGT